MPLMCKACTANPVSVAGFCSPCWTDTQAEAKAKERTREQSRLARSDALRRLRPSWRPDNTARGHGQGSPALARRLGEE
jgi:hypothetical protein